MPAPTTTTSSTPLSSAVAVAPAARAGGACVAVTRSARRCREPWCRGASRRAPAEARSAALLLQGIAKQLLGAWLCRVAGVSAVLAMATESSHDRGLQRLSLRFLNC